jgi:hypothetical protein
MDTALIDALQRELDGYERNGKTARAAAVRKAIAEAKGIAPAAVETTASPVVTQRADMPKPRKGR